MKSTTAPFLQLASLIVFGSALLLSACSKSDHASTTANPTASRSSAATEADQATRAMLASAAGTWDNIKDYSYNQRAEFAVKTQALADQLDLRTATAKGSASRQLAEVRDELRTAAAEVGNATAETWESTKERAGRAWQKAESQLQNVAE